MVNPDNSSHTTIVAMGVIAILILALAILRHAPRETITGGQTNVNVENSTKRTDSTSTAERS